MVVRLKPVSEQVIVITGASSGIGLSTARMAAKQGAKLVLAARSEQALHRLRQELEAEGVQAVTVNADVGNEAATRPTCAGSRRRRGTPSGASTPGSTTRVWACMAGSMS